MFEKNNFTGTVQKNDPALLILLNLPMGPMNLALKTWWLLIKKPWLSTRTRKVLHGPQTPPAAFTNFYVRVRNSTGRL